MQISNMSTQNFGKFIKWDVWPTVTPSKKDIEFMENVKDYIDKSQLGERLTIYGTFGTPNPLHPNYKYIRLKSYPNHDDMGVLLQYRPDARCAEYSRHSLWFSRIDRYLTENIKDFLIRQSGYINYCVKHPEHSLARRSVKVYEFK